MIDAFELSLDKYRVHGVSAVGLHGKEIRRAGYNEALDFLYQNLPDRLRAFALCEAYLEHYSWL